MLYLKTYIIILLNIYNIEYIYAHTLLSEEFVLSSSINFDLDLFIIYFFKYINNNNNNEDRKFNFCDNGWLVMATYKLYI